MFATANLESRLAADLIITTGKSTVHDTLEEVFYVGSFYAVLKGAGAEKFRTDIWGNRNKERPTSFQRLV